MHGPIAYGQLQTVQIVMMDMQRRREREVDARATRGRYAGGLHVHERAGHQGEHRHHLSARGSGLRALSWQCPIWPTEIDGIALFDREGESNKASSKVLSRSLAGCTNTYADSADEGQHKS
jgi:hypothetical protein